VKSFSWRWLLLAAVPACVLIQPLDKAVPDSSGNQSEAGSLGSAGKHTGSAGSDTQNSGDAAGSGGDAGAGESSGGSTPGGGTSGEASGGKASGGTSGRASGGTGGKASGGSSGAAFGGASPAGGSAGAPAPGCKPPGGGCAKNVDCCQSGAGIPTAYGATCIASDGLCHVNCTDGAQCVSGCCTSLVGVTAYGVCAAASECACLPEGTACTPGAPNKCCGGSVGGCYPGDSLCHRLCTTNADCPSNCCDTSVDLCAPSTSCGR
jgi:hypothetical protein